MNTQNNEIVLCCGRGKCPILRKTTANLYEIQDDDGNIVSIKKDQLELIAEAIKELDDKCSMKR